MATDKSTAKAGWAPREDRADGEWAKTLQFRRPTIERFRQYVEVLYPDKGSRPPMREIADLVMIAGLNMVEASVKPEPSPADRLAALVNQKAG